jgi:sugar phosphate isomerase/epimerase
MNRRNALARIGLTAGGAALAPSILRAAEKEPWLRIAVQQYSFNRQLRSGELDILDFPKTVVEGAGIKGLEYFNGHIEERAGDAAFFRDLRRRTDDLGATNTMMLCRSKPALDSPDAKEREKAIEGYRPWMEGTRTLGGKWIRVDTRSKGDFEEQKGHAVAGLRALCEVAEKEFDMEIVVENHGGHSGNGAWLADVMKRVGMENCGTLPDFQNFTDYDPYQGVKEMMPWAKVVCAKSKEFDAQGDEVNVDYRRMLQIVKDSGFRGWIGIEFEGHGGDPLEGILATKRLIEKVMANLT